MGRVVTIFLRALRCLFALAGASMIGAAVYMTVDPTSVMSAAEPIPPLAKLIAGNLVWCCIGIPLLLPTKWLFGRGRWPMLLVGFLLWFGPMGIEGDHDYGWLIRFFASLVAVSVLSVWKTIFALTQT